jgi:hypothetical protein
LAKLPHGISIFTPIGLIDSNTFALLFSERATVDPASLHEKIYVNFRGLKQDQRCSLIFETRLAIWKIYLAGTFFLLHASSGFPGPFTVMR